MSPMGRGDLVRLTPTVAADSEIDHFNEQPRFGNCSKFVHMKF